MTATLTDKEAFNLLAEQVARGEKDGFAADLVQKGGKYGLSEAQFWWIHKLGMPENKCELQANEIVARFTEASFNNVAVKHLRLYIPDAEGGTVKFAFAGPRSKHHGDVWVTDDGEYPNNKLYGRIPRSTGIFVGRDVPDLVQVVIQQVNDNAGDYMPW